MTGQVVPFGKYKGQPAETLAADRDYCEWLLTQPWFTDKYHDVYNIVVNYGAEPQDSPEHNQMQAQFLEDEWCFALADLLYPERPYSITAAADLVEACPIYQKFGQCVDLEQKPAEIRGRNFEHDGWDVVYSINSAIIMARRTSLVPPLPACTCQCDHTNCAENAHCHGGDRWCRHSDCPAKRSIDKHDHCTPGCYWLDGGELTSGQRAWLETPSCYRGYFHGLIRIELKPDLGDDYPSVLRQVKNYPHSDGEKRCVIARRHTFQHVTWEHVRKIFAASDVDLIAESSITPTKGTK